MTEEIQYLSDNARRRFLMPAPQPPWATVILWQPQYTIPTIPA